MTLSLFWLIYHKTCFINQTCFLNEPFWKQSFRKHSESYQLVNIYTRHKSIPPDDTYISVTVVFYIT